MMSNIIPFMISYLYHKEKESKKESSLTQNDGYFIHPLMSLAMSIRCFFGGIAEHYLGPRIVILLGGILIFIGDFLFTISKSLVFDFFINIFFGIGFAIGMTAAVKNASEYFPNKRGLINALAGGVGGNLGSSFFNLVIKYFVSKGDHPDYNDNDMYKITTAENYKIFFYIHGGVVLGNGIISALLLVPFKVIQNNINVIENSNNEEDKKNEGNIKSEENIKNEDIKNNDIENHNDTNNNINYKSGLKIILTHMRIYQLLLIFLFTSFLQGFIFIVGFNYGTMDHGGKNGPIGGDEMSIIFMLTSLITAVTGPLFGIIYDKFGFKYTIIVIDTISVINGCLISLTVKWGSIYYGISIILNGCLNGGAFSMIFPYVSKIYGFNYGGELYGFVVLSTGISSIISASTYYIISIFSESNTNKNGAYLIIFIIGIILNIMAIILAIFEKNEPFIFEEKDKKANALDNNKKEDKFLEHSVKEET